MQELREDSSDELSIPGNALGLRLTLLLWWITLCSRQLSPIGSKFLQGMRGSQRLMDFSRWSDLTGRQLAGHTGTQRSLKMFAISTGCLGNAMLRTLRPRMMDLPSGEESTQTLYAWP